MKKRNTIIKICLAFVIPFMIMIALYGALHIFPFGDKTLNISDADLQYSHYYSEFIRMLRGEKSFLYSFSKSIGGNFIGLIAYYLCNPFFLIFRFANIKDIPAIFNVLIILCCCTAGLTCYLCLQKVIGYKGSNLILSTSYAICGYNIIYCFHLHFLPAVFILPLIVMGIYKLVKGEKPYLYIISIAFGLLSNFYIGYMLCIASVLFFFMYFYFYTPQKKGKTLIIYTFSSIIGGLLPAFLWMPTILTLVGNRASQDSSGMMTFTEKAPFISIFAKLFSGTVSASEIIDGSPNIFCGIFVVFLVILFFTNKKIIKKKKMGYAVIGIIYLISFFIPAFTYMFQGFSATNWFPFRYSFIFTFLLINIAAEELNYFREENNCCIRLGAIILITAMMLIFSTKFEFIAGGILLLDLVILSVIILGVWFYQNKPGKTTIRSLNILILICVSVNLYLNGYFSLNNIKDWFSSYSDYKYETTITGSMVDYIQDKDTSFYRMENEHQRSGDLGNDPFLYGYNGIGSSSSTFSNDTTKGLAKLGATWFLNRNSYDEGITGSMDSLLGVKYIISKRDLTEEKNYELVQAAGFYSIYENPYALPLGIISNVKVDNIEIENNWDVFDVQNIIWKSMTGGSKDLYEEENNVTFKSHNETDPYVTTKKQAERDKELYDDILGVVDPLDKRPQHNLYGSNSENEEETKNVNNILELPTEEKAEIESDFRPYIEYSFSAKKDGPIYVFLASELDTENGTEEDILRYIGSFSKGDIVTKRIYMNETVTDLTTAVYASYIKIAYADLDVLSEYSSILKSREINIEKENDDHLKGAFTTEEGQELILTIPYDEGWIFYLDGNKTPIKKIAGLFIGVDVPEGEHSFEMKFYPKGLREGIIISLIACACFIGLIIVTQRRKKQTELGQTS